MTVETDENLKICIFTNNFFAFPSYFKLIWLFSFWWNDDKQNKEKQEQNKN